MTKKEALAEFRYYNGRAIRQWVKDCDYVARAEAWNDYTWYLCDSGLITKQQYESWVHPWKR